MKKKEKKVKDTKEEVRPEPEKTENTNGFDPSLPIRKQRWLL